MEALLTIVIPTFNRKDDICKQVIHLDKCISSKGLKDVIKVIVSDNHSEDGTYEELLKMKDTLECHFQFREQIENIGGTFNSRSVIKNVRTQYVMLLGDDDFLDIEYLPIVVDWLTSDNNITAVFPNFYSNISKNCRDTITEDKMYEQGVKSARMMFKAHQMSGIVFKADRVLETLFKKKGENRYYQTYCMGFNILRGNAVHITRCPLCVNDTNQKYWSYGGDGLWDDMFKNIKILDISHKQRCYLERYYLRNYSWSMVPRLIKHPIKFVKSIYKLENMTKGTKWLVLPYLFISSLIIVYKKKIKKVGVQK